MGSGCSNAFKRIYKSTNNATKAKRSNGVALLKRIITAAKRVKNSLVLAEIATKENITVSEEQFESKIKELAALYHAEEKDVYTQLAKNVNMTSALTQQILAQNITNYLMDNNKVKYVSK